MKTSLSVLALAFCVPAASATAQEVRFGILGGVSLATIEFDPDPGDVDFERLTGPVAGGSLEIGVNDNFAIEPRALWVRKGAKVSLGAAEARTEIDYVSVPVLFKLRGGGAIRPYLAVGPEVAFKLSAKSRITAAGQEEEEDIDDQVKSTDFGLMGVAGLEFAVGRVGLFLEGGYSYGLTSIEEDDDPVDPIDAMNRTILVLAGIRF